MSLKILCKAIGSNNVQEEYTIYQSTDIGMVIEKAYCEMSNTNGCTLEIYVQDAECHKLVAQFKLRSQVSLFAMPEIDTQVRVPGRPKGHYYIVTGSCILHNGAESDDGFRKGILLTDSETGELHSVCFQEWFDLVAQAREAVVREREQAGTQT